MKAFFLISWILLMKTHPLWAETKTIYLVRHAEVNYTRGNHNPSLTPKGQKRALALRDFLKDKAIEQVFCTEWKRTRETAKPTADHYGLEPKALHSSQEIVEEILKNQKGSMLVVAHSNTIPIILHLLKATENELPEISHSVFNLLFTLKETQPPQNGEPPSFHLDVSHYGE